MEVNKITPSTLQKFLYTVQKEKPNLGIDTPDEPALIKKYPLAIPLKKGHTINYMQNKLLPVFKAYRFRILSGVLFLLFLINTWFIFYQKPEYSEEVHINLQEQLKAIIRDTLSQKQPQVQNFQFQKMWTQATNKKNQISAHFKYSFDDEEQINISVEGHAIMNRKALEASEQYDLWSVDHIEINNTKLEFQEPITLLSSSSGGKEDTSKKEQDTTEETSEETEQPKKEETKQAPETDTAQEKSKEEESSKEKEPEQE